MDCHLCGPEGEGDIYFPLEHLKLRTKEVVGEIKCIIKVVLTAVDSITGINFI